MLAELISNLALLVALSVVSGFLAHRWPVTTRRGVAYQGSLFGATAVLGMMSPAIVAPGLFFDGRSVVISLCGLFFGPWAAIVAAGITVAYRVWLGGLGMLTGVLVVTSSALVGAYAHDWRAGSTRPPSTLFLYLFGLVVHAAMLVMLFVMPLEDAWRTLRSIGLPVMVLYPLATILAGRILSDQAAELRAHDAVRESEERLRLALSASGQGLFDIDLVNARWVVSDDYAQMLGFTPGEFIETHAGWIQRLHPDDRDAAALAFDDYLAGRRADYRVEYRQRTKTGGWTWVMSHGKIVAWSDDGRPTRMLGTHTDITERKEATIRLAESVKRFELATRVTFNAIWDLEPTRKTLWWNEHFFDLFGYRPADVDLSLAFWLDAIHPDDRARVELGFQRAIDDGASTWSDAYRFRRGDGTYAFIEDRADIARDGTGRATRLIGAMQDVSERHRAEADVRLQSAALNAAANAIVITGRDGTIAWVNPAFTALTGFAPHEAVGQNPRVLKSGLHERTFYAEMWSTLLAGKVWRGELTNQRKNGQHYLEGQTITPVKDARGEITHFIAIKKDLTQQRELELKFLQAQKMELLGRFAGGIAHDFNNLLTVINGTAQFLALRLKDNAPACADLATVSAAGERAAALTRQLLGFSRRQVVSPVLVDLVVAAEELRPVLARLLGATIDLRVHHAIDQCLVRVDKSQLEQVVMNLVVNARDAMPDGGQLAIGIGVTEVTEGVEPRAPGHDPGRYATISVSDTGVGMDEETLRRIFEPFFTTKGVGDGTGLGLATVQAIVAQLGGHVRVHSRQGHGTTFDVLMPLAEGVLEASNAPLGAKAQGGSEVILLVEDEDGVRRLAERVLTRAGYSVLVAASGEHAIAALATYDGPLALLITDAVLPGISGRETAQRVAALRPGIRILYSSGFTDDETLRQGVSGQAFHFIGKPYTLEALSQKVREVLDAPLPSGERSET